MNYQESIKQVMKNRINLSKLKAGHIYKNKETGVLYRILGFTLDTENLDVMVIYSEVNDPIASNLFNTPIDTFIKKIYTI